MVTSAKSKKHRENGIDRPFEPAVLARAKKIAASYQVIMWQEDGEYFGRGVELPLTMDDGKTADECMKKTREAFVVSVAYMLENGEIPPAPAMEGKRDVQLNIRISAEEKLILDAASRRLGYASVSDYIRSVAIAGEK
jgi:predicted RNase H-like HicB family nuclease